MGHLCSQTTSLTLLWSFIKYFILLKKKETSLSALCELTPVIILLPLWIFSALHFLGFCKKANLPSATSPSHRHVKTYSLSTVSIIPPASAWEQKQICRDILQYNNNVTMSTIISPLYIDAPNHHRSKTAGTIGQEGFYFLL